MAKKIFVGSLDWGVTGDDLRELFSQFGDIEDAVVISDKFSGRSKGFGFVTFTNDGDVDKAMSLNDSEFKGRKIIVNEARPPKPRY